MRKSLFAVAVLIFLIGFPAVARADIYLSSELWVDPQSDGIHLTSHVTAEDTACSEEGPMLTWAEIQDPNGNWVAGASSWGNNYCSDMAESYYSADYDSWTDGNYVSKGSATNGASTHGCVLTNVGVEATRSVFRYDHFNVLTNKHEYQKDGGCNHACQPPRMCSDQQNAWAAVNGTKVSDGALVLCYWSGTIVYSAAKPTCKPNTLGAYLGGFNEWCD